MLKKIFRIGLISFVTLNPFALIEVTAADDAGAQTNSEKSRRAVMITGTGSAKLSLPPPCSIVDLRGKSMTLRDFYGKAADIQVEDATGMKVGDKVVVKDGVLITGVFPQ